MMSPPGPKWTLRLAHLMSANEPKADMDTSAAVGRSRSVIMAGAPTGGITCKVPGEEAQEASLIKPAPKTGSNKKRPRLEVARAASDAMVQGGSVREDIHRSLALDQPVNCFTASQHFWNCRSSIAIRTNFDRRLTLLTPLRKWKGTLKFLDGLNYV